MTSFKTTFCRARTKIHFLGLFDTVNSVGLFDNPFAKKNTFLVSLKRPPMSVTQSRLTNAAANSRWRCFSKKVGLPAASMRISKRSSFPALMVILAEVGLPKATKPSLNPMTLFSSVI